MQRFIAGLALKALLNYSLLAKKVYVPVPIKEEPISAKKKRGAALAPITPRKVT